MANKKNQRRKKAPIGRSTCDTAAANTMQPALITPTAADLPSREDGSSGGRNRGFLVEDTAPVVNAAAMKDQLYSALIRLFEYKCLHRQWLVVDTVIAAITDLSIRPRTGVPPGVYRSSDVLPALRRGLGADMVGDNVQTDFECPTDKDFFLAKKRGRDRTLYFLYVDTQVGGAMEGMKIIPQPQLDSPAWIDRVMSISFNKIDYFPVELLEITNYWYSPEAADQFNPFDGESSLDAAKNMLEILTKAANSDEETRRLIDGLNEGDSLP